MRIRIQFITATFISLLSFNSFALPHAETGAANPDCLSCGLSKASAALSIAGSTVVEGSMLGIGASGVLVIESVRAVGNGIVIVMKGTSDAASVTVQLSGEGIRQLGLVSGAVLQATAVSTGHLLISAGKIIAFIPNELGKALIYHSKVQ
jgi:hypothetical protein